MAISDKNKAKAIIEALSSKNTVQESLNKILSKGARGEVRVPEEDLPEFTEEEILFF